MKLWFSGDWEYQEGEQIFQYALVLECTKLPHPF